MLPIRWAIAALALILSACATPAPGVSPHTLTLAGQITRADHQTYRELPFTVPPGVSRITIDLTYDHDQHTVIDLGLRDPDGQRGWSGGNKSRITVSAFGATPSYRAGPLTPGTWTLVLGVPNIREGVTAKYAATVSFDTATPSAFPDAPISTTPGWRRGDLHMHTGHSDGTCANPDGARIPCPVTRTLEAAQAAHLEFIAVTDHNTLSQAASLRELQPAFPHLLLIPGMEVTTFYGHANAIGLAAPVDFQLGSKRLPNLAALLDQVAAQGAILSINHPGQPSNEDCMGCGWTAPMTNADWARITAVEAVNGGSVRAGKVEGPGSGLQWWTTQLLLGRHIIAVGGSDNHDATDMAGQRQSPIGSPTTVVWTHDLSQQGVLDGLRAGRVFIDLENKPGRVVDLVAKTAQAEAHMGDTLRLAPGEWAQVGVTVDGVDAPLIDWSVAGLVREPTGPGNRSARVSLMPGVAAGWVRVDVRSSDGKLLLVSNPIFVTAR